MAAMKDKAAFYGTRADADIRWLVTPSPTFNYMMGGGIPVGRMIRFRGPASAGKTVIATWCAGLCQKEIPKMFRNPLKKVVLYLDIECSFARDWANQQGLSTNDMVIKNADGEVVAINADGDFIQLRGTSIEAITDEAMQYIETGNVAAVVFDSDGQAASKKSLLDESGKACVAPDTMIEFEVCD